MVPHHDGTGTSGSAASALSGIYQVVKPNLRASYMNSNKKSFYPEITQQVTSDGRRNIPQNVSYQENAIIQYQN